MRIARAALVLLMLLLLAQAVLADGKIVCEKCGYENPGTNKFCFKCGNPLHKSAGYFIGSGSLGKVSDVSDNQIIIDKGSQDGIKEGDYFHTLEITEVVVSTETGDTLDFRTSQGTIIKITEVSQRVAYGSYRVVGKSGPQIGDGVYPHHRVMSDKRWTVTLKFGGALVDDDFPICQQLWPDWNWADLTQVSPTQWGPAGHVWGAQLEYMVLPFVSLGAEISQMGFNGWRPQWAMTSKAVFSKVYWHHRRTSLFVKGLYGKYSGQLEVDIWFTDRDPHYPRTFSESYSATYYEYGAGIRFALSGTFGLLVEYTKGNMILPDEESVDFNGYIIPLFHNDAAKYGRIELGLTLAFEP